jgi:hypothetical protein
LIDLDKYIMASPERLYRLQLWPTKHTEMALPTPGPTSQHSFIHLSLASIIKDTTNRCYVVLGMVLSLPVVVGVPTPALGYPNLDSADPNYYGFILNPSSNATVLADSRYFRTGAMQYQVWISRAHKIRDASSDMYCSGNLSVALGEVRAPYQARASGSTTLLTLLLTAGALIDTPAKELWVLYKLVPLSGILSSALSLGGSIVHPPSQQIRKFEGLLVRWHAKRKFSRGIHEAQIKW